MKNLKKLLALSLALTMAISMVSCGKDDEKDNSKNKDDTAISSTANDEKEDTESESEADKIEIDYLNCNIYKWTSSDYFKNAFDDERLSFLNNNRVHQTTETEANSPIIDMEVIEYPIDEEKCTFNLAQKPLDDDYSDINVERYIANTYVIPLEKGVIINTVYNKHALPTYHFYDESGKEVLTIERDPNSVAGTISDSKNLIYIEDFPENVASYSVDISTYSLKSLKDFEDSEMPIIYADEKIQFKWGYADVTGIRNKRNELVIRRDMGKQSGALQTNILGLEISDDGKIINPTVINLQLQEDEDYSIQEVPENMILYPLFSVK